MVGSVEGCGAMCSFGRGEGRFVLCGAVRCVDTFVFGDLGVRWVQKCKRHTLSHP